MLNLGYMLGAGIYSFPGAVLNSVGSIGLLLVFWLLAPLIALCGVTVYSEYASLFPKRSGARVVYLEQAYPRPRYLVPVTYAVTTVLLIYEAVTSIVFAQYVLTICDVLVTPARQTAIALAVYTVAVAFVGLSTKWSLIVVNFLAGLKVLSLVFLIFTGAVVLYGFTRIRDPFANFRSPFSGSTTSPNSLATALIKTNWAFAGWHNAFVVLGEVHTANPVRTVRKASFLSLLLTTFLFLFVNVAYVVAVPKDEISSSGQLIGALFFQHVFGKGFAARILPIMVALTCFGTIVAGTVGQARVLREIARQGLLPYPRFFASTRPFGTLLAPICLQYFSVFALVAFPAEDAFNFLVDLLSYPNLVFHAAIAVGVWLLRRRRIPAGLTPSKYYPRYFSSSCPGYFPSLDTTMCLSGTQRKPTALTSLCPRLSTSIQLLCSGPWCPGNLLCGVYYWIWIVFLPRRGGYTIVEEVERLEDGALTTRFKRKYLSVAGTDNAEQEPLLPST
ncbi:hypothetical protein AZE42_05554 [Rhizopogon vesiculosus]|uniref:Amino acid permease/ SLC12A domain-containing protein n=1 Tax=Rhizopogon vesiculosus TaxID=180088 RepID=A0A1J8QLK7_9AGAM|nr:hypothetical protein AZE42_05554 [Rhizopogon vesiculosus]